MSIADEIQRIREGVADAYQAIADMGGETPDLALQNIAHLFDSIMSIPRLPSHVYTVEVTSNNDEWGSVTGGGIASKGMIATLQATPTPTLNDKYIFKEWAKYLESTDAFVPVTDRNPTEFVVEEDIKMQAIFEERDLLGTVWFRGNDPGYLINQPKIAYGNGVFVAISYNSEIGMRSEDGLNWTRIELPDDGYANYWCQIIYADGMFIALARGAAGVQSSKIVYSSDGLNWSDLISVSTYQIRTILVATIRGTKWFMGVTYGSNKLYYTSDINTWTTTKWIALFKADSSTGTSNWHSVAYDGESTIVIASESADLLNYSTTTSTTLGVKMNPVELPETDLKRWYVAYGGDKFIAVAYSNDIAAYSYDGATWVETKMPDMLDWGQPIWAKDKFIVPTIPGEAMAISYDGIEWTLVKLTPSPYPVDYERNYTGLAYGNGMVVAVSSPSDDPPNNTTYSIE